MAPISYCLCTDCSCSSSILYNSEKIDGPNNQVVVGNNNNNTDDYYADEEDTLVVEIIVHNTTVNNSVGQQHNGVNSNSALGHPAPFYEIDSQSGGLDRLGAGHVGSEAKQGVVGAVDEDNGLRRTNNTFEKNTVIDRVGVSGGHPAGMEDINLAKVSTAVDFLLFVICAVVFSVGAVRVSQLIWRRLQRRRRMGFSWRTSIWECAVSLSLSLELRREAARADREAGSRRTGLSRPAMRSRRIRALPTGGKGTRSNNSLPAERSIRQSLENIMDAGLEKMGRPSSAVQNHLDNIRRTNV